MMSASNFPIFYYLLIPIALSVDWLPNSRNYTYLYSLINYMFFACHFTQVQCVPEAQRKYQIRKRQPTQERAATFVCYTCGFDTPSTQLRLVYCCPNAEREPYFPFIKTMKAPTNASPISPQGKIWPVHFVGISLVYSWGSVSFRYGANLFNVQ